MAIKKLTELYLFNALPEDRRSAILASMTGLPILERATVSREALGEQLALIQRRYKYPSKARVLADVESGAIRMVYDKAMAVPSFLPAWLVIRDQRVEAVVNLSLHARETGDGFLEIDPKRLFGLAQCGTIALAVFNRENKIVNSMGVVKGLTYAYTRMFVKCLDRLYALNLDGLQSDRAAYLVAKWFQLGILGRVPSETVDGVARQCTNNGTPQAALERAEAESSVSYESISDFTDSLANSVAPLSTLQLRTLVEAWTRMYGDSTVLALESMPLFAMTAMSAVVSASLNNEAVIAQIAGSQLGSAYLEFFNITR